MGGAWASWLLLLNCHFVMKVYTRYLQLSGCRAVVLGPARTASAGSQALW